VDVTQLAAVPGNRCVILTWTASGAPSHAGYHVYRGDDTDGPFERLTEELLQPEGPHRYEDHGCRGDHRYAYRVGAVAADGSEEIMGPVVVTTPQWAPLVTALSGVVPNPFRNSTELRFSLAAPGPARLSVYDVGGRLVRVLCDGELPAGDHVVTWKAGTGSLRASAGIYFVRLETGERRVTKRVVLLGSTR
jgi:hypothetical protein